VIVLIIKTYVLHCPVQFNPQRGTDQAVLLNTGSKVWCM